MLGVWLLPEKETLIRLSRVIDYNQYQLKRPSYIPHMTLLSGGTKLRDDIRKGFQTLELPSVISLPVKDKVKNAVSFFMAFYLQLDFSAALRELFARVKQFAPQSSYRLQPHISLAYGVDQNAFDRLTVFELDEVTFDSIALVNCPEGQSNQAILSWEVLEMQSLR